MREGEQGEAPGFAKIEDLSRECYAGFANEIGAASPTPKRGYDIAGALAVENVSAL
jgi:hypothetical protein